MKVFIQKIKGEFANVNLFTAWTGFRELGYETVGFEFAELAELALDRETVVCGGIPTVLHALALIGVPISATAFNSRRTRVHCRTQDLDDAARRSAGAG